MREYVCPGSSVSGSKYSPALSEPASPLVRVMGTLPSLDQMTSPPASSVAADRLTQVPASAHSASVPGTKLMVICT